MKVYTFGKPHIYDRGHMCNKQYFIYDPHISLADFFHMQLNGHDLSKNSMCLNVRLRFVS